MITSEKSEKIKYVIRLQQKARFRKEEGLFVCEGARLVMETPLSLLERVYLAENAALSPKLSEWLDAASQAGVFVETVGEKAYSRMSGVVHSQGILAVVRMPEFGELPDGVERSAELERSGLLVDAGGTGFLSDGAGNLAVSDGVAELEKPLLVFLENLQDPGNLGTILRTAEAAGATGVVAGAGCVDFYSPKVVRSTMGSIFRLPHFMTDDLLGAIRELKERGMVMYGAMASADSSDYDEADFAAGCGILIGNEGAGLSEEAATICDRRIAIPMRGQVESLNAGMATGILLFEAARQRRQIRA